MTQAARTMPPSSAQLLKQAAHRHRGTNSAALLERVFTFAFRSMVYPQIWEDPRADLEALELTPSSRMVTIASGGCNALSYLVANPARIYAVDLNDTHVALLRLKLAAAARLPSHTAYDRFFGGAADHRNAAVYDELIAPHLDAVSRAYWERRDISGRRRITRFARNFYRFGLLGRFIGAGHLIARALGANPSNMLTARTRQEQREIFDRDLAPLFDKPIVKWATSQRASLFGLGIPPAQYDALCDHGRRPMASVLKERVERLATGFEFSDNYFAWQAFSRGYCATGQGPRPPYLEKENFTTIKVRADRITVLHQNLIHFLRGQAAQSLDRYSLLDAQDWMDDVALNALWAEITRTAEPGARVIFRTAGTKTILPERVDERILSQWTYEPGKSAEIFAKDRSAIYGGFHLYVKSS